MKRIVRLFAVACILPASAAPQAAADGDVAQAVGPCTASQICAFSDPEDLADLDGTPWLMVSESARNGSSGLAAFNTHSLAIVRVPANVLGPSCLPGARGGGIGVRRERNGYRLVRILHARGPSGMGSDAVESLRVTFSHNRPVLTRTGCVAAPDYFLNDIAPLPDGAFAATHMFDPGMSREAREAAFLAGAPTGYVVRWTPASGWTRLPGSDGTFPNGIDASPDGRWLAFAEIYGRAINRIRTDGSQRARLPLAMQPDNVTALPDGSFVAAGGTGRPLVSTRRCPQLRRPGCGFPAMAVRVDFKRRSVQTIALSGGAETPGFSVGVMKGRRLYLGTAFGDRITILRLADEPATMP